MCARGFSVVGRSRMLATSQRKMAVTLVAFCVGHKPLAEIQSSRSAPIAFVKCCKGNSSNQLLLGHFCRPFRMVVKLVRANDSDKSLLKSINLTYSLTKRSELAFGSPALKDRSVVTGLNVLCVHCAVVSIQRCGSLGLFEGWTNSFVGT